MEFIGIEAPSPPHPRTRTRPPPAPPAPASTPTPAPAHHALPTSASTRGTRITNSEETRKWIHHEDRVQKASSMSITPFVPLLTSRPFYPISDASYQAMESYFLHIPTYLNCSLTSCSRQGTGNHVNNSSKISSIASSTYPANYVRFGPFETYTHGDVLATYGDRGWHSGVTLCNPLTHG